MSSRFIPDLQVRDHTRDRYHALSISSVWDLGQIRASKVLVVGAGALGNEVCKNLAMMGVQLIGVVDRDTVEMANLSRSVFFREADHGRPKVDVISERLKELNPDVEVLPISGDLDAVLGMGLLQRMDVVFSCLDSRLARRSISRMCEKVGRPWIDAGMEDLIGYVAAYTPGQGACYECTLTNVEKAMIANVASCRQIAVRALALGKVPTTSTMGSILAAVQVQEAVKIIQGDLENSLAGRRLIVDCNSDDFYITQSARKENCEGHFRFGEIRQVTEFSAERTTASDVLQRFKEETGESGHLDLGREIVVRMSCPRCGTTEKAGAPLRVVTDAMATCPNCHDIKQLSTTHVATADSEYANIPLSQLGIPKLDTLAVLASASAIWYELTGDLESFPETLGASSVKPPAALVR